MGTEKQQKYSVEFKQTIVNLYNSGKTYAQINANNLSIKIRFTQSKKSNRIFGRKHLTLMREFGTRSRPSLNDRYRLFQA